MDWISKLQQKWSIVPGGSSERVDSNYNCSLSDHDLLKLWKERKGNDTTGDGFSTRGWYHFLYKDFMRGKRVLDVGSGFGIDSLTFAQYGAEVTSMDIVQANLSVIERLANILRTNNKTFLLNGLSDLDKLPQFDVIWCCGSMHHAPFNFVHQEAVLLADHLKTGGRWIQLAYPKERWEREGSPDFSQWGVMTDGENTPWAEWYDLNKIKSLLSPHRFETILDISFQNYNYNWFDMLKIS